MEGQSDAHFNHTFHLFFLSTNKCKEEILLLAFVHTSALYGGLNRPKHISNENHACAMQGSFTLIWQHGTHGYHSLCFPSQIEDAPLLDLWPWAASAFTQRRCCKCFFTCLFFVFVFLPCERSKHNSLRTKNPLARHKCCCAVRLYLIVIYCPNDFHISCYCSRFLLECSRPAAVHRVCALNVAGFIYVMFFNWACCDLFMPPRISFVLLLSLASPPSYSVKRPQLAVNSK